MVESGSQSHPLARPIIEACGHTRTHAHIRGCVHAHAHRETHACSHAHKHKAAGRSLLPHLTSNNFFYSRGARLALRSHNAHTSPLTAVTAPSSHILLFVSPYSSFFSSAIAVTGRRAVTNFRICEFRVHCAGWSVREQK
jgi:hypothetical protein